MRRLLRLAICVALTSTLAAEQKVIHASAPASGIGRYRVTIASEMVEDLDLFASQVPAMCRCRLEPYAEEGFNGVMIRASAAAAKMLSADPRVVRVEEMPVEVPEWSTSDVTVPEVNAGTAVSAAVSFDARPATEAHATPWDSGVYGYDGAGNIKSIGTKKYAYDALGRLTSAGESTAGHRQQYTYDPNGNLLTIETYKPGHPTNVKTITVEAGTNRILTFAQTGLSATTAQYDAAGRMTKFPGGEVVKYDAGDMIVESRVGNVHAVHLYTASDERIATIGITETNVRQGADWTIRDLSGKVLRRFKQPSPTAPWVWDEDYIYRDGQLLAAEVATQERTLHFHPDHLGTPRLITGNGGAEVSARELHPFGEELTVPDPERMTFTGHERDAESLDYMHARYYAVQWGRFLSVDPVNSANAAYPQSWNRYAYGANNPLNKIDPDGRATRPYEKVARVAGGAAAIMEVVGAVMGMGAEAKIAAAPLRTVEKLMRLGDSTGTALGKNSSGSKLAAAIAHDVGVASEATLLMAGAAAPAGRVTSTTQLFRAVDNYEAADIAATASFRASPNGTEFKGFFFLKSDAEALGGALSQQTGDAYSVVSGQAPTSLIRISPAHQAAGEGAGVLIRNEDLVRITPNP